LTAREQFFPQERIVWLAPFWLAVLGFLLQRMATFGEGFSIFVYPECGELDAFAPGECIVTDGGKITDARCWSAGVESAILS
jgi:hypothetical protein